MSSRVLLAVLCWGVVAAGVSAGPVAAAAEQSGGQRLGNQWMRDHLRSFPPEFIEEGPEMSIGFYESLRTLTLWRLAETLDLGEEELVHFFPRFNRLEKARQEYRHESAAHVGSLEEALASDDLKRIKGAIDAFRETRDRFLEESLEMEQDLLEVLTVEQQARYLIFMETVAPEIEGMLRAFHQLRS